MANKTRIAPSNLNDIEVVLPKKGLFDSSDCFRRELLQQCISPRITDVNGILESDQYCSEHRACRLCFHRVYDPTAVIVPLETAAEYGLGLIYSEANEKKKKIMAMVELISELEKEKQVLIEHTY